MKSPASPTVDDYLAGVRAHARAALEDLRAQIKGAAPGAEEIISYRIPTFTYRGQPLVAISAHDNHCSLHLMSPPLAKAMEPELKKYLSGVTLHFKPERPLPASLVKKIVEARLKEMGQMEKGKA